MPRSGAKSGSRQPPELSAWQRRALGIVANADLGADLCFGGGAALAAVHLHHRTSEDLDFFSREAIAPERIVLVGRTIATPSTKVDIESIGPRTSLVLRQRKKLVGKIDFAYYPFDPIGRRTSWKGLRVESLVDMTVNKVQAILTRFQPRDFVDLMFLLREGPEHDLVRLLDLVRAKFDVGAQKMSLAARLLLSHDIRELPRMLRPVTVEDVVAFCEARARELASP